ncbi:DUF4810 domain-containing protein [Achromobacter insolitus]|uniref:DUF4810 domain-containing protein n=1 Tax=Achromobacter insolitus TaxID=217204 RepID=UPI0007C79098|nr:DUF4810 domain-containing protein [Achromobacter insolitus]OAE59572.1 DUF4810 domain-containing protein [Achromobacter insolitus]OCZ55994.1 DUF4810 domain-containing protein [Achromobacter insolitus]
MSNSRTRRSGRIAARVFRCLVIGASAGLLGACVQQPKPMYSWQAYQPSVYAYLKDDGADYAVQAQALEKNVETARAASTELPPGFRAHLCMLYLKIGDGDKALEQLQGEKVAFPESAPFMDFLMRNAGKPPAGQQLSAAPAAQAPAAQPAAPTETLTSKKGS